MIIVDTIKEMQRISRKESRAGKTVAVVPTMGYLHKGHLSLIEKAKSVADSVITTIFVNPAQFAPHEDFDSYPRDLERDSRLASDAGTDFLFTPLQSEMYPTRFLTSVGLKDITSKFEGVSRPDHFNGVALIVAKLFNSTLPDIAIFGQKDLQQSLVIKKMTADLNFPIEIIISPTIRESNGLAMSSRNKYLDADQREKAGIIFKALEEARNVIESGERRRKQINAHLHKVLRNIPEIHIDYASAALSENLSEPEEFLPGDKIALLIAVYLGKTRLIDNAVVDIPSKLNQSNFIEG